MGGFHKFRAWSACAIGSVLIVAGLASSGSAQTAEQAGPPQVAARRPRIGVAFGGGSARGIAHVGVIRWLEEHRIPIDVAAGTSMGGLIGGAYASGMAAAEIDALLEDVDWDAMFGSSSYQFKNIRRKEDARAYPSHLEFGLRGGVTLPTAINDGQQVDFLLARIAAPYYTLASFDQLPTPFRCVAVDLRTAQPVVLERGSFAQAMRATMSLPGIFPPIEMDNRVLVDGGAMNNIPADVVRAMGADVVVAVNVGSLDDPQAISGSLFGVMGATLDAMMRASTRRALEKADIVLNVPVEGFGSLDWRRSDALIEQGYKGAELIRDQLIKFAVDEPAWQAFLAARQARRRTQLPVPAFVTIEGAGRSDTERMERLLQLHVGKPLNVPQLETDLASFLGLDRYQTIDWEFVEVDGKTGLRVPAREKTYAPPLFMIGLGLENLVSDEVRFRLSARYLRFDVLRSGSELRVDGTIGSDPAAGAELYIPFGQGRLFGTGYAGVGKSGVRFTDGERVIAKYSVTKSLVGGDIGVNLSRDSEVRLGLNTAWFDASVESGQLGLPELSGQESIARLRWLLDTTDSVVVPSRGWRAGATLRHFLASPTPDFGTRTNDGVTQGEIDATKFWSFGPLNRVFGVVGGGTSFDGDPLPTQQFELGYPFRVSAFSVGEVRGDNLLLLTVGYMRGIGRLPDFLGGPIFVGGWLENGSVFDEGLSRAQFNNSVGVGIILDTLLGPFVLGTSVGSDGDWRTYFGLGRIFR